MKEKLRTYALVAAILIASLNLAASYGQTSTVGTVPVAQPGSKVDSIGQSIATPSTNRSFPSAYGTTSDIARTGRGTFVMQTQLPHRQTPLSTALVVLAQEASEAKLGPLTEDLNIMCRIFDRTLTGAGLRSGRHDVFSHLLIGQVGRNWGDRLFGDFSSWTECLYVEGHGPLFVMRVDFPLVEAPKTATAPDPNGPSDPVWAEVSQGLYAPPGSRLPQSSTAEPAYNPVKALSLKKAIIRALKHAANIRGLAPEASVTVMVKGTQSIKSARGAMLPSSVGYGDEYGNAMALLRSTTGRATRMSQLVIRAKIEDIKAFSSGALSDADFAQRIQSVQY